MVDASPTLSLAFGEEQRSIQMALARFCEQRQAQHGAGAKQKLTSTPLDKTAWRELAALGALTPGLTDDSGGAQSVAAICETLGEAVFPGPLAASYCALALVNTEFAEAIASGEQVVALLRSNADTSSGESQPPLLFPLGSSADIILLDDGRHIALAEPVGEIENVSTLGGELWGRAKLQPTQTLPNASKARGVGNIAFAAYLGGAGMKLVRDTSEYASTRKQFGKTLGDFQAIAHPLADCAIALTAAQSLTRAASCALDNADTQANHNTAAQLAAAALLSAQSAALQATYTCHQVFGAIGVTLEGPVFRLTRKLRQTVTESGRGDAEKTTLLAAAGL